MTSVILEQKGGPHMQHFIPTPYPAVYPKGGGLRLWSLPIVTIIWKLMLLVLMSWNWRDSFS